MKSNIVTRDKVDGFVRRKGVLVPNYTLAVHWRWVGRRADGSIKWIDENHNLVVDEGLEDALDVQFLSGTQTATASWFILLTEGSPTPAPGDTLATHPGWTEWSAYAGNRPAWGQSKTAAKTVSNATPVTFTSNANGQTVGGGGVCTVASGTAGTLFNVSAFSQGNRSLDDTESVDVTVTITNAST